MKSHGLGDRLKALEEEQKQIQLRLKEEEEKGRFEFERYTNSRICIEQLEDAEEFVETIDMRFSQLSVEQNNNHNGSGSSGRRSSHMNPVSSGRKLSTHTPAHRQISPYSRTSHSTLNIHPSNTHSTAHTHYSSTLRSTTHTRPRLAYSRRRSSSSCRSRFHAGNNTRSTDLLSPTLTTTHNSHHTTFTNSTGILFDSGSSLHLHRNETSDLSLNSLCFMDEEHKSVPPVTHTSSNSLNPFQFIPTNNTANANTNNNTHSSTDSSVSLLVNSGQSRLLHEAFADQGNIVCHLCQGLIPKRRYDSHILYWCESLNNNQQTEQQQK